LPRIAPPRTHRPTPREAIIPAGTVLWRVHPAKYPATAFKEQPTGRYYGGGRFDCTEDKPDGFTYAAGADTTALMERFVRSLGFGDNDWRVLRHVALKGQRLAAIKVTGDLRLIGLMNGVDLTAVYQDEWLLHADEPDYPQTRDWARWMREHTGWAQGLQWPSKRHVAPPPAWAVILFRSRCPADALEEVPGSSVALDSPEGAELINNRLAPYRVKVKPPPWRRSAAATITAVGP
jgi:hypothetical protein